MLRDSSRVPRRRPFIYLKPSYAIGSVPSLSGHAVAYRWRLYDARMFVFCLLVFGASLCCRSSSAHGCTMSLGVLHYFPNNAVEVPDQYSYYQVLQYIFLNLVFSEPVIFRNLYNIFLAKVLGLYLGLFYFIFILFFCTLFWVSL